MNDLLALLQREIDEPMRPLILFVCIGVAYYRIYSGYFWEAWAVVSKKETDFFEKLGYILNTVIVVSHDKHYWTVPDRLLEMNNGQIREMSKAEIDSLIDLNN